MSVGIGLAELLIVLLLSGASGGGMLNLMGLPPGERDARLMQGPPEGTVLYVEWSARSEGKPGAAGIDGLAADPEIRLFFEQMRQAVLDSAAQNAEHGPPQMTVMAEHLLPLYFTLLNRPACAYLSIERDAQAAPDEKSTRWQQILAGLRGALIVNGGDEADAMAGHLDALLKLLPADVRGEGFDRRTIPIPDSGGLSVTIHRHGNDFLVGLGKGTIDRALAGLEGKAQGLAGSDRFQSMMKRVTVARTAHVMWLDVRQLTKNVATALGPLGLMVAPTLKTLGVDEVDAVASMTGVVDGKIVGRTFIRTGGRTEGLLALAAGRAITADDFARVPADADLAAAVSLDLKTALAAVRAVIKKSDPSGAVEQQFDALLGISDEALGFSLEEDLLPAMGEVWTVYDSPESGGVFLTNAVVALEVKDARKAYEVFTQLMARLKDALPGEYGGGGRRRAVFLAQTKFLDRTIYYINSIGNDSPFSPAFCVTDKQWLIAPHPQALKAHLRFLKDGGPNLAARFDQTFRVPEGGEPIALSMSNPEPLVRWLWALAPYWGQMVFSQMQQDHIDIDIFALPSARGILPYLGPSRSSVVRVSDGLLMTSESALPLPSPGLLSAPSMWLFGVR